MIVLAVGISGIQQFGDDFYIEPFFNGATLIASIAIAGYAQRRRRVARKPPATAPVPTGTLIPLLDGDQR